jgi:hypothetical protein
MSALAGKVVHKVAARHSDRLDWTAYAVAAAEPYLQEGQIKVLISSTPPVSNHLAALYLKKKYPRVKWVADFRDPLAGSPFRIGYRLQWLDTWLERAIFVNADLVTAVTDAIAEEWQERYPEWKDKIRVIWNAFDPDEDFGPQPHPPRDHCLMTHVGDLYGERHPGLLLSAWARLIARGRLDPKANRLSLIGPIETSALASTPAFTLLEQLAVLSYNNRRIPRPEAMQAIAQADQLLLLDLNAHNIGHTVPAKLFDYLRSGHPILALTPRSSVVRSILAKSGVPNVCIAPDETESEIDEKVGVFFDLATEPVRPNSWFWDTFDGRRQTAALAGILAELNYV